MRVLLFTLKGNFIVDEPVEVLTNADIEGITIDGQFIPPTELIGFTNDVEEGALFFGATDESHNSRES